MDPISIATAVATATTALYTVSNLLCSFVSDAKNVDKTLGSIRSDIDSLLKILETIKGVLIAPSTQPAFEAVEGYSALWDAISASVKDCSDTAESINKIVGKIKSGTVLQTFVAKSIRQVRFLKKTQDIDKIQVRVITHKTNLQLSLQTMNILVAQFSSNHMTENIGPKVDELWRILRKIDLKNNLDDGIETRSPQDSDDANLARHTNDLRASTIDIISRTVTEDTFPPYEKALCVSVERNPTSEEIEDDSDEELEVEISLNLMAKGVELCNKGKFNEAEATLQNSLQAIQRMNVQVTSIESIKEAQLKLAVVYLFQEKWDQAEEILLYLSTDSTKSDTETKLGLDAHYYLAQVYLARHNFDLAIESCKEARSGRRKHLGKQHSAYFQSVVLLILIYETSNDRTAADVYAKTIPAESLSDRSNIAVLRFSSEGSSLSIDGELAALKLLLKNPYGPNFPNNETELALRWAAGEGYKNIVQLLLWRGVKADNFNMDKETPLMRAAGKGSEDVTNLLLDKGANINIKATNGDTALKKAALNGHESVVRLLLDRGAEIDGDVERGWSTVMIAATKGHDLTLRLLIERGATVNVMNTDIRRTALMYAAREGHDTTVAILLEAGAEINARDTCNSTALDFAEENSAVSRVLVDAGGISGDLDPAQKPVASSSKFTFHVGRGLE